MRNHTSTRWSITNERNSMNLFSERRKELGSLFSILGENHRLSEEQIHSLLEWKHGKMDYISDYQVDTIDDAAKKTQE